MRAFAEGSQNFETYPRMLRGGGWLGTVISGQAAPRAKALKRLNSVPVRFATPLSSRIRASPGSKTPTHVVELKKSLRRSIPLSSRTSCSAVVAFRYGDSSILRRSGDRLFQTLFATG